MADEEVVPTGPTARVADSYGPNPHEHKPSQDPWDPETAEEKQAETGDAAWDGASSSTSPSSSASGPETTDSDSTPARSAESRTDQGPKVSSTARSTGTGPRSQTRPKAK